MIPLGGTACFKLCAKHWKQAIGHQSTKRPQLWKQRLFQVSDACGTHLLRSSATRDEQAKKATRVRQFSREYFDLAAKHAALAKYISFDKPVLVNLGDTTYQIHPEESEKS